MTLPDTEDAGQADDGFRAWWLGVLGEAVYGFGDAVLGRLVKLTEVPARFLAPGDDPRALACFSLDFLWSNAGARLGA